MRGGDRVSAGQFAGPIEAHDILTRAAPSGGPFLVRIGN